MFERTDEVGVFGDPERGIYLVASSFEPRSVRTTKLVSKGAFSESVIFNYEDTLDNAMGRHHVEQLKMLLEEKTARPPFVLRCSFADPYSVVRSFGALLSSEHWLDRRPAFTVDATCFTKIHLLLLLKYIADRYGPDVVRVCYTEPLTYATAFNRHLSYGIERTVYLPYQVAKHSSKGVGLVAFLGHERLRLERIVQELEPDITVIVLGEPGFSRPMLEYSRRVNATLIHRAEYDGHYRIVSVPANDVLATADLLQESVEMIRSLGCDSVYIVALGTKLQAVGIEVLRRRGIGGRLLLGYAIPKSYERNMYSQGSGPTYIGVLPESPPLESEAVEESRVNAGREAACPPSPL